ncbi:unnamed protein product [Amoebophrya sp. A120]|nr:unnamed protein product [Amoebophrya sp. A120]|eukprot:GSA120T00006797001.1
MMSLGCYSVARPQSILVIWQVDHTSVGVFRSVEADEKAIDKGAPRQEQSRCARKGWAKQQTGARGSRKPKNEPPF